MAKVNIIDEFVNRFSTEVWDSLGNNDVKGIGISGSYARGDYSLSRPDINFALFVLDETPQISLKIGEIVSSLNKVFVSKINLRPEYHPDRFVYPWGRDKNKPDLFFKIAMFSMKDKDLPLPFGRPGYVIEGHKLSIKMLYGKNYFEDIPITANNDQIIKGVAYSLSQWQRQIKFTPLSYNFEKDMDLFFNESLVWGKLSIQHYAWTQGIKNGLDYSVQQDRNLVFSKIHNEEELRKFLVLSPENTDAVNLILDARLNYDKWKNDKKLAKKLFLASSSLIAIFMAETAKLTPAK